ncbi:MAG: FtsW/RodA/SpoVE family cell cycle protein [Sporichthyaceae bacterium]
MTLLRTKGVPQQARRPLGGNPSTLEAARLPRLGAPARPLARFDAPLIAVVAALCGFGVLMVLAATRARDAEAGVDEGLIYRHIGALALGTLAAVVVARADRRRLRVAAPVVFVLGLLGLVLVLTPLGAHVNGAKSWVQVAGVSVQPVELAKIGLVLGLAAVFAERREQRGEGFRRREIFASLGLVGVTAALVMLQPDLGSTLVLVAILAGVLLVGGVPLRWMAGLAAAAGAAGTAIWYSGVLSAYQLDRIAAFVNPAMDPAGVGYNAVQARIAVASGGVTGAGLFDGSQTVGQFVPEQHTDFIFTVAAEQLGLLGGGAVIAAFAVLLWRACGIAGRADLFGSLVCAGIVAWFAVQTFQNIGMSLGLTPVTGLPLPFLSYGGTAMVANLVAVGLLLNVQASTARRGTLH